MLAKLKSECEKEPDSIEANRAIAEYYVNNDMLEEAEPYLVKMLDIDGEIASAHNQLGVICFKRNEYSEAERYFRKALQVDFGASEAHFNLAFLYQTQGRPAEALPYYKEVVKIIQDDPEVYHLMGQCAQAAGMFGEAEAFLEQSFGLAPTAEPAVDLSILYISQEKYAEAEDLLTFLLDLTDRQTEKQRSDTRLHINSSLRSDGRVSADEYSGVQPSAIALDKESLCFTLGLVLAKQGKYMNAIKHLRDVVMIDDRNEQAFNYLGECCAAIGLDKEAESFFAKASKVDPQYLQPIANLGKLYYDQGEHHKAIVAMERYIEVSDKLAEAQGQETMDPQYSETAVVYELLGKSYTQIGNKEKAAEIWKESLEIDSDQPELIALINNSSAPAYRRTSLSIDGPSTEIDPASTEKQVFNTETATYLDGAVPGNALIEKDIPARRTVTIRSMEQLDQLMGTLSPRERENLALQLQEIQIGEFLRHSAGELEDDKPIGDRVFFITGTGRCGTMFLADLLNKNTEVQVYHEPLQFSDRVASLCAYDSESFSHAYIEKRRKFVEGHFRKGGISYYGEVNPGLGNHIIALQSIFNAPVYLLVRDGRKVVRSLYSRNHFRGNHTSNLIRPKKDSPYFHEWGSLSRFEKLCWFWASLNEAYLNAADNVIRFEDLISDWEIFNRIFNVDMPLNVSKDLWLSSVSRKTNATPKYQLPPYENWSDEQKELFDKHCGKMMLRFGYEY